MLEKSELNFKALLQNSKAVEGLDTGTLGYEIISLAVDTHFAVPRNSYSNIKRLY